MVSEDEGWITGPHVSADGVEGQYWHALDGGKTWAKEAIKDHTVQGRSGWRVALAALSPHKRGMSCRC